MDVSSQQEKVALPTNLRLDTSPALQRLMHPGKSNIWQSLWNSRIMSLPHGAPFASVDHPAQLIFLRLLLSLSLLAVFGMVYRYIQQDYRKFLAMGPGGTPYCFRGYAQLSLLSFFKVRNPYIAPETPSRLRPKTGFLKGLQPRQGCRPKLVGIAPQRQVTQICSPEMVETLQATIRGLAQECPSHWYVSTSAFEKYNEALFSKFKTFTEPDHYGEIVHSHASDGSMHLTLHPEDVKTVLEKGWGERHPLARGRSWWWYSPVPRGFMIIYGPRNRAELQQVKSIIRAAAWWVSGVDSSNEEKEPQDTMTSEMESKAYEEVESKVEVQV